jgi:hypothetical protein
MSLATDLSTFKNAVKGKLPKEAFRVISESIETFVQTWNPAKAVNERPASRPWP